MERGILSSNVHRTQVLVVGAGPAGLVAGITLGGYGIDVLVVDKRPGTSTLSRNLVISTRGMELMRRFGLEEAVRAGAADVESRAWVTSTLSAGEGVEMPVGYPSDGEAAAVSPTRPAWAPQDHHEPLLLARLRQAPSVRVRLEHELLDLGEGPGHGFRAQVLDRSTSTTIAVDADYVIAADGSGSAVRAQLGVPMDGPDHLADYERVEFVAPLDAAVGDRRYALYVITRPGAVCVLNRRGRGDRWGLSRERLPGNERLEDLSAPELTALIARAAGVDDLEPRIERLSRFSFAAQMARTYRCGNAFLVGDAAHRMTPRGGTGMNTAIQDAFDLGWKLAFVLKGWAAAELLDTYEAERRPVAVHNVGRAAEPGGARRSTEEALPWDLNGRIPHHWTTVAGRRVSTLDLVGGGLTVLTGPEGGCGSGALRSAAPVTVRTLDMSTATAMGLG
ncbi:MAG TPA: FAD-dependent monooxygenase, partial [Acidimicrobiales bacterium]|nr:FAD-dependent monooxygenase [Acidimicrobiales bacterium]